MQLRTAVSLDSERVVSLFREKSHMGKKIRLKGAPEIGRESATSNQRSKGHSMHLTPPRAFQCTCTASI